MGNTFDTGRNIMAQYTLSIHDYWRIIRRRERVIFFTALLTIIFSYIYTSLQTPVYKAMAVVKVEPKKTIPGVSIDLSRWDMHAMMSTEVKIIRSAVVAERTALKLNLIDEGTT